MSTYKFLHKSVHGDRSLMEVRLSPLQCVVLLSFLVSLTATSLRHHAINENQAETLRRKREGMSQEVRECRSVGTS